MVAYKKFFKRSIDRHFPNDATEIIRSVEERFKVLSADTSFAATSSNPIDRRLDFSAYFLALIKTMEAKEQSFEQIKSICLEITYAYVAPRSAFHLWLKRLPPKLTKFSFTKGFLKLLNKKISKKGHPNGFRATIITDKAQTFNFGYGVDILECGICKLFQKHDAHKYASILCEVDKVTTSLAGLEMIRTGTIAYGAEKCDFRYKRIKTGA
jgi:hypothetical protein